MVLEAAQAAERSDIMPQKNIVSWETVPVVMDIPLAAQIVGMNPDYLRQLAAKGKFPAYKISKRIWRVDKEDLMVWKDSLKAANTVIPQGSVQ